MRTPNFTKSTFDWARQFPRFAHYPSEAMLSTSWSLPIAHLPTSRGFQCCRIHEGGNDIRHLVRAYPILTRREHETWTRLPGAEKRRKEWLLGRVAAKDAVRLILRDGYQLKAYPADIEIVSDEHGKPIVSGQMIEELECRLSLSIAHSEGGAVAVAVEGFHGKKAGIDVEQMDGNHEGLEDMGFTTGECSLLDTVPAWEREEWLLRLWCAKEAVAKALGRGLMGSPFNIVVQAIAFESGRTTLRIEGQLARELCNFANQFFTAYTGRDETLVFGTVFVSPERVG